MQGILKAIGNTPLIPVESEGARLLAKFEGANPGGSVKDRPALGMILGAERRRVLKPGGTVIEATSGNTGVGLALVAGAKSYGFVAVLPETVSPGKKRAIRLLGGQVVETPESEAMLGSVKRAEELARENGWFWARQFDNPDNPRSHLSTAAEILRDAGQAPDAVVLGWGTGGTLTGIATVLKAGNPDLLVVAYEPEEKPHGIEGICPGFVPDNLDTSLIDRVVKVSTQEAWDAARYLCKSGIPVGPSSGAAWLASRHICREMGPDKLVVTLFPDRADRYPDL